MKGKSRDESVGYHKKQRNMVKNNEPLMTDIVAERLGPQLVSLSHIVETGLTTTIRPPLISRITIPVFRNCKFAWMAAGLFWETSNLRWNASKWLMTI